MDVKALIRKPLVAAVLGGAFVAVPASALFLYSSEHSAEAAALHRNRAAGGAGRPRRWRADCPISVRSCSATGQRSST